MVCEIGSTLYLKIFLDKDNKKTILLYNYELDALTINNDEQLHVFETTNQQKLVIRYFKHNDAYWFYKEYNLLNNTYEMKYITSLVKATYIPSTDKITINQIGIKTEKILDKNNDDYAKYKKIFIDNKNNFPYAISKSDYDLFEKFVEKQTTKQHIIHQFTNNPLITDVFKINL
jgi:hypothetical protein